MIRMKNLSLAIALVGGLAVTGCATKAQTGALVGSGVGAGAGYLIGKRSGHGGTGAAIGGLAGAGGGYMIGNELDKNDQAEIDQAEREREAYDAGYRDRYYR